MANVVQKLINEYEGTRKAKFRRDSIPWMTTYLGKLLNKRYNGIWYKLKVWQKDNVISMMEGIKGQKLNKKRT